MARSQLNVELALVTKNFDKALGRTQRRLNRFGFQLQSVGRSLTNNITLPLSVIGGASVKAFADFEQAIAKVRAVSGATGQAFDDLRENALELGRTTQFTASQVAELQLNLSKLGFSPTEINASTAAILDLALATGEDLASSASTAAATLRGFGIPAEDTIRVTNIMADSFSSTALDLEKFSTAMAVVAPIAQQAGATIEETTAVLGLLANRGVDASTAGTSLRNIFLELANNGLTWNQAMDKINNSVNPLSTAMELFGKRGATVATIIANNRGELNGLTEDFIDAEGEARGMASIMENTLRGSVLRLKSAVEGAAISIGEILAPTIQSIANSLNDAVTGFNQLSKETKQNIIRFAAIAASIGPVLIGLGALPIALGTAIKAVRLFVRTFTSVVGVIIDGTTGFKGLRASIQGAIVAFRALDLATKATIVGALATAVIGLVVAFRAYNNSIGAAVKTHRQLNEIQNEGIVSAERELSAVRPLIAIIEDEATAREEKLTALNKLKQINPDYFGQLDVEKGKVDGLTEAYDNFKKELILTAQIKAAEEALTELARAELDVVQATGDLSLVERVLAGFSGGNTAGALGLNARRVQGELEDIGQQREAITNFLEDRNRELVAALNISGAGGSKGRIGAITAVSDGVSPTGSTTEAPDLEPVRATQSELLSLFDADPLEEFTPAFAQSLDTIQTKLTQVSESTKGLNADLQSIPAAVQTVQNSLAGVGEIALGAANALAQAAQQGKGSFAELGRSALAGAAQVARAKIIEAVTAFAADAFAKLGIFGVPLAIAAGGIVGGLFNSLIGRIGIPALADGGLVTNPTLALIGEAGPEAVIPLDRMNQMGGNDIIAEARVSGSDLIIAMRRAERQNNRIG